MEESECRICFETDELSKLISPCLCNGSLKYVHPECLFKWMSYKKTKICSVCYSEYNISLEKESNKSKLVRLIIISDTFTILTTICLLMILLLIINRLNIKVRNFINSFYVLLFGICILQWFFEDPFFDIEDIYFFVFFQNDIMSTHLIILIFIFNALKNFINFIKFKYLTQLIV